jgi:DNA-binding MarR family transcriptional regulator
MANDLRFDAVAVPGAAKAAGPRGCTNLKLKQASRCVARHFEAHVGPTGLKATQYSLLSHVVKLGPIGAGELAAVMRLDPSTLSRNLQPLIDKDWVQVRAGVDDARSRVVEATETGLALRVSAQQAWKRGQLALNQRLGEARVAALHALLDECMSLLDATQATSD